MSAHKLNHPKQSIDKFTVVAIDFHKIYTVRELRVTEGYSAYELSFLIGKTDFFVRDVENPLSTKRYNPDDTNYLLLIFNKEIRSLMRERVDQNLYQIEVVSYLGEANAKVYEIKIKDSATIYTSFMEEPKHIELPTSRHLSTFTKVQKYVDELLEDQFFDEPKRGLDVFEKCKTHFGSDFHPRNMIQVLNYYTNKKSGIPKIMKENTNQFGRRLFIKRTL
jgi:hypothetical protein